MHFFDEERETRAAVSGDLRPEIREIFFEGGAFAGLENDRLLGVLFFFFWLRETLCPRRAKS